MATPKHDIRVVMLHAGPRYGGSEYEHLSFRFDYIAENGDLTHATPHYGTPAGLEILADLVIDAQRHREADGTMSKWYGYKLEYSASSGISLERAQTMVKGLRKFNRAMDKLQEQLGYPQDVADFAARAAIAVGATGRHPFGQYRQEVTFNGTHYQWGDATDLRYWIDKLDAKD